MIYNLTQAVVHVVCATSDFYVLTVNRCTQTDLYASTSPWLTPEPFIFRGSCNLLTVCHSWMYGVKSFYVQQHIPLISALAETHANTRRLIEISISQVWSLDLYRHKNKHLSAYFYIWRWEMKLFIGDLVPRLMECKYWMYLFVNPRITCFTFVVSLNQDGSHSVEKYTTMAVSQLVEHFVVKIVTNMQSGQSGITCFSGKRCLGCYELELNKLNKFKKWNKG